MFYFILFFIIMNNRRQQLSGITHWVYVINCFNSYVNKSAYWNILNLQQQQPLNSTTIMDFMFFYCILKNIYCCFNNWNCIWRSTIVKQSFPRVFQQPLNSESVVSGVKVPIILARQKVGLIRQRGRSVCPLFSSGRLYFSESLIVFSLIIEIPCSHWKSLPARS